MSNINNMEIEDVEDGHVLINNNNNNNEEEGENIQQHEDENGNTAAQQLIKDCLHRLAEYEGMDPRENMSDTDKAQLDDMVRELERMCYPAELSAARDSNDRVLFTTVMKKTAYSVMGLDPNEMPSIPLLEAASRKRNNMISLLMNYARKAELVDFEGDADQKEYVRRFSAITEAFVRYKHIIYEERRIYDLVGDPQMNVDTRFDPLYFDFQRSLDEVEEENEQKLTPKARFTIYLCHEAFRRGYRRYRGACYEQIFIEDEDGTRRGTHAWKEAMDIKKFIYESCDRGTHFKQWNEMINSRGCVSELETYFSQGLDKDFREIKPSRHTFAFSNGIYDAQMNHFYKYGDPNLTSDVVACKYFDEPLDWDAIEEEMRPVIDEETGDLGEVDVSNWWNIQTGYFQGIWDYQNIEEDAAKWGYVSFGRLLYNVGEHDDWQYVPFVKGVANSGKSTLGKVAKSFYSADDIGILANNIERMFGLAPLKDKFMWVCFEVKSNFGLDQAAFQSMVSGEDVSIPQKFKDAICKVWTVPGLLIGNEVADWVDSASSISRRILLFEFPRRVTKSDPELYKKLKKEIPRILVKCNIAYRIAVANYGDKGLWSDNVLPDYFLQTQGNMKTETNSLASYILNDENIVRNCTMYMPLKLFANLYNAYCKRMGLKAHSLTPDFYQTPFDEFGLTVVRATKDWGGKTKTADFVIGVGVSENADE